MIIQSVNARGLRQENKRFDLFNSFKQQKLDIILVQETHWTPRDIPLLSKEWNVTFYCAGVSTNSKGVSIIINNTFEHTVTKTVLDKDGRYLLINLELPDLCCFSMINVYGPNSDDTTWLESLQKKLEADLLENQVWMGDWNTPLEIIDIYNYQSIRHKNINQQIKKLMNTNGLIDIWREQNPDKLRFTWGTKKPFKRSRLDYCLISQNLMGLCPKAEIKASYRSDHCHCHSILPNTPETEANGNLIINCSKIKNT